MRSFIALFGLVATVFAVPVPQGSITGPLKQIPAVNGVVQAVGQLAEPVTGGVLPEVLNVLGGVPVVGSTAESTVKGVVATASNLKRQSPLSGLGEELQPVAQELGPVLNIVDGVTSEVGGVGPVSGIFGRQVTDPVSGVVNVVKGVVDGTVAVDVPILGHI